MSTTNSQAPKRAYSETEIIIACAGILLLLTLIFTLQIVWPTEGHAAFGIDIRAAFVPWFSFAAQSLAEGYLPLWDPFHAGGYPFLHNPQASFFYPPTWLALLLSERLRFTYWIVLHIWLSGLGMLLFVRAMGGHWLGAVLASLSFAFSHYIAVRAQAGHLGLMATNAWFPWLLLATAWSVQKATFRSATMVGIIWALSALAGHSTSLLYINLGWVLFLLFLMTSQRPALVLRQTSVAVLVGLALSAAQLLPTLEFALMSTRVAQSDLAFAMSYSLPFGQLMTLLAPDTFGGPVGWPPYWGPLNYWELTYYAGILPIVALILTLYRPSRLAIFYLCLLVLTIMLAIGQYGFLYESFYHWLPPFRLARAPARAMFLAIFVLCGLLGETISHWERMPWAQRITGLHRFAPVAYVCAGLVVAGLFALVASSTTALNGPTELLPHFLLKAGSSLALLLIGAILLVAYLRTGNEQVKRRHSLAIALVLFVILDLFPAGFKFLDDMPVGPDPLWRTAQTIIGDQPVRVLTWDAPHYLENDATRVGVASARGYNPLQFEPYVQLVALADSPASAIYDLLAVTHILSWQPLNLPGDEIALIHQSANGYVYQRPSALPLARLVTDVQVIPEDTAALEATRIASWDPATTVILNEEPGCRLTAAPRDSSSQVRIIERRPGYWLVETESLNPAILVMSETAFPGWRVKVNDLDTPWYTAYTALRAVCVAAGTQRVEWKFDPWTVKMGMAISLFIMFMLTAAAFPSIYRRFTGKEGDS